MVPRTVGLAFRGVFTGIAGHCQNDGPPWSTLNIWGCCNSGPKRTKNSNPCTEIFLETWRSTTNGIEDGQ